MSNLTIHGLDLTAIGIGDVEQPIPMRPVGYPDTVPFTEFIQSILGSITFGPAFRIPDEMLDEAGKIWDRMDEDDHDWGYAE